MSELFVIAAPVVLSFITAIITTILTTYLINNRGYRFFHKGSLTENIRISKSPQVFQYEINNSADKSLHIQDCDNYIINAEELVPQKISRKGILEFSKRWIYLYVENNTDITISFARIHFEDGRKLNLYDWSEHFLKANERKGVFICRNDEPQSIVLDYNGSDLIYEITNKMGYLTFEMKQPYRRK